jgi:hypothetical protein
MGEAPMAEEAKDTAGRLLATASLVVAFFSLYYTSLDKRFYGELSLGASRLKISHGPQPAIALGDQIVTFSNTGNQPISIENIAYSVFSTNESTCGPKLTLIPEEMISLPLDAARFVKTVPPAGFAGLTIRPGENETKKYSFAGPVLPDQFKRTGSGEWYLIGCLYVNVYTSAKGKKTVRILLASEKVTSPSPPSEMYGEHTMPVSLISVRWPFY